MAKPTSTGNRRKRLRLAAVIAAVAAGLVAALAGGAFADNAAPDGDNTTPVAANPLAFGTVCVNSATNAGALVAISRNGSATGTNTFQNSAAVTVTVLSVSGTGLSASMDNSPATITLPSNWTSLANNTMSDAVSSQVTLVAASSAGSFSGSVTYRATGKNTSGTTITRDAVMSVSATVSGTGACAPTPPDTTPPTVTVTFPNPVTGQNGWFNAADVTPVEGSVIASDASNVTDISCTGATLGDVTGYNTNSASGTLTVSGDGTHDVSCTATDGANPANSGAAEGSSNTATIKIDTAAPIISDAGFGSGTSGNNGWYISAVTENFTASDATSGLADCATNFTQTSTSDGNAVTIASGPCSDNAGNTNPGISSAPYMIDTTRPGVTCDPAPTFLLNQSPANVSATVTDATSGPASSPVTAAAGTSSVGQGQSVSVTGNDNAGNSTTVSCLYNVSYGWSGFLQPINDTAHFVGETTSVFKAGSTVPVKFQLTDASGAPVQEASPGPIWLTPQVGGLLPSTATVDETVYTSTGTPGGYYRWDSTGLQYIYNWNTAKNQAGHYWRIGVTLDDGNTYYVSIGLR